MQLPSIYNYITHEAVHNAVIHGKAKSILVKFSQTTGSPGDAAYVTIKTNRALREFYL